MRIKPHVAVGSLSARKIYDAPSNLGRELIRTGKASLVPKSANVPIEPMPVEPEPDTETTTAPRSRKSAKVKES